MSRCSFPFRNLFLDCVIGIWHRNRSMASSTTLNEYCLIEILKYVPFQKLFVLRAVCTDWKKVIDETLKEYRGIAFLREELIPETQKIQEVWFAGINCEQLNHQIPLDRRILLRTPSNWKTWNKDVTFNTVLRVLPLFPKLTSLVLDMCGFWLTDLMGLKLKSFCPLLEHLVVVDSNPTDGVLCANLQRLQHFELHIGNFSNTLAWSKLPKAIPALKSLTLANNKPYELCYESVAYVSNCVDTLSITGTYVEKALVQSIALSLRLTTLKLPCITNRQLETITRNMTQLVAFEFWGNMLDIRLCANLTNLEEITFSCVDAKSGNIDSDISILVRHCPKLRSFGIKCLKVRDATAASLLMAKNLETLRLVSCNYKETTDGALRYVSNLPKLKLFEITNTKITDWGVLQVVEALGQLEILSLNNNKHVSEKLLHLLKEKHYAHLLVDISHTSLSEDTMINCKHPSFKLHVTGVDYESAEFLPSVPREYTMFINSVQKTKKRCSLTKINNRSGLMTKDG